MLDVVPGSGDGLKVLRTVLTDENPRLALALAKPVDVVRVLMEDFIHGPVLVAPKFDDVAQDKSPGPPIPTDILGRGRFLGGSSSFSVRVFRVGKSFS